MLFLTTHYEGVCLCVPNVIKKHANYQVGPPVIKLWSTFRLFPTEIINKFICAIVLPVIRSNFVLNRESNAGATLAGAGSHEQDAEAVSLQLPGESHQDP